ncbi:DUF2948 family protein [Alphaproteobacteria bacterium]|nr:DUF2948 family protein [Alphaproteobacteria bacterium]
MNVENKIKLNAFSNDDLKIFSYLCQDAILSQDEFFFDKNEDLFVATFSRYCWEKDEIKNSTNNINYRVISGLYVKHVKQAYYNKLNYNIPFLNLLAISYKKKKITLHFSSSIEFVLECEKIEAYLEDIDIPWPTKLKPEHE